MWLPREVLSAVRHQVKRRGWHPITSENWGVVRDNLLAEARPAPHAREPLFPGDPDVGVAKFVVPMVRGESNTFFEATTRQGTFRFG